MGCTAKPICVPKEERDTGSCTANWLSALLMGFLRNSKFKIRPNCQVFQDYLQLLRKDLEWEP